MARRACDTGDILPAARGARPHLALIADIDTLLARATERHHAEDTDASSVDADHPGGTGSSSAGAPVVGSVAFGRPGSAGTRCGVPPGELQWGGPISAEAVRRIACDAGISRVITDPNGVPLDVCREARTVTPSQYVGLVARDGGCVFPGCTRPPAWTEAHHIIHWADGGATSLENLVLLCGYHHRTVHHRGWLVRLAPDQLPEFIPPAWIDPTQTPQRSNRPRYHRPIYQRQRPP